MIKREAKFCTQLGKWWDNVGCKEFYPDNLKIEAKISIGNYAFNLKSGFKPHQLPTMIQYNTKPMHWKISDMDTISTKHYDISCDQPAHTKAIIAIHWVRKGNKTFYLIDPAVIQTIINHGDKSINEFVAAKIAYKIGELK